MIRKYAGGLIAIFAISFAVALLCLGTEARSVDRAVTLARIQDGGPQWAAAEAQYPELSVALFRAYGDDPALGVMLRRWGHNATFPVIGRCFPDGRADGAEVACGRKVIASINTSGADYLRQFAVDKDGVAHRLLLPTASAAVEDFLAGGLETVERKRASGETVTLGDWGSAGLDVVQAPLLVAAGAESLAARGVAAEGADVAADTAARDGAVGVRETAERSVFGEAIARAAGSSWVWKTGSVLAVGYVAIRHPGVITALGGYAARLIGLPAWAGQAFIWALGAVVLAMVVPPLLVMLMLAGRGGRMGYRVLTVRAAES